MRNCCHRCAKQNKAEDRSGQGQTEQSSQAMVPRLRKAIAKLTAWCWQEQYLLQATHMAAEMGMAWRLEHL